MIEYNVGTFLAAGEVSIYIYIYIYLCVCVCVREKLKLKSLSFIFCLDSSTYYVWIYELLVFHICINMEYLPENIQV